MIGLMYWKESMSVRQMHQKNAIFVITGTFYVNVLNMNHIFAMSVMIKKKKLWMMLLLLLLKEVIIEFIFGIWSKMMQWIWWKILI